MATISVVAVQYLMASCSLTQAGGKVLVSPYPCKTAFYDMGKFAEEEDFKLICAAAGCTNELQLPNRTAFVTFIEHFGDFLEEKKFSKWKHGGCGTNDWYCGCQGGGGVV